jgi:CSLREA domain-containing protein
MQTIRKVLVLIVLAWMLASTEAMAAVVPVTVTIATVTNISAGDPLGGAPDFYARVNIAGQIFESLPINDTAIIAPGWTFTASLRTSVLGNLVPIRIEIWDSDDSFGFGPDLVDVDPDLCAGNFPFGLGCSFATVNRPIADTRGLDLTLDPTTGAWKGFSSSPTADAAGGGTTPTCATGTESESATVCFTITVGAPTPEELVVTKLDDTNNGRCLLNDCSLREAVNAAWNGDTVTVPDLGKPYSLTYSRVPSPPPTPSDEPGHLKITQQNLTICGRDGGAVIQQTLADTRVIDIHAGASVDICNLTIMGGAAGRTSTAEINHLHGGGIHNHGKVTLRNVTLSYNRAPYTTVGGGGGLFNAGIANLLNVTISQNTANSGAGGIESNFASNPFSETRLRNTLIANNTGYPLAPSAPLPGNCNPAQGLNAAGNVNGFFNDGGNLQFPGATCGTAIPIAPAQPISAPVTKGTYPLTNQGLAIDGGTNMGCPSKDQLGVPRPQDGNNDTNRVCDVGALEMLPGITLPGGPEVGGTTRSSLPSSPHPAH